MTLLTIIALRSHFFSLICEKLLKIGLRLSKLCAGIKCLFFYSRGSRLTASTER